jgi:hypothetical protein
MFVSILFFHPKLLAYNIVIYPKGHNIGYIGGNPQKPCNNCWKKYAKPFSGPLVYSFPANSPSSSLASNLQKPLPHILPSSVASSSASFSQPARLTRNNPNSRQPSTSRSVVSNPAPMMRPMPPVSTSFSAPAAPRSTAGNSVTYYAGDPRIGGRLCWKCGGQGSVEMFIFQETCTVCSGIGRILNQ